MGQEDSRHWRADRRGQADECTQHTGGDRRRRQRGRGVVVEQAVARIRIVFGVTGPVCPPLGPSQTRTPVPHYPLSIHHLGRATMHVMFPAGPYMCGYVSTQEAGCLRVLVCATDVVC